MTGPASARTDRLLLLTRLTAVGEPGDILTWRIDGRPPTADELRLLWSLTLADACDLVELMLLDAEIGGA